MKYEVKSILIGRKPNIDENEDTRPCFVSLFDENNPHLSMDGPKEILEFPSVHKVIIEGLDINYLLPGNDLIVNDLEEIEITIEKKHNGDHLHITGKQNS